jgi:hypothetical protein
LQQYSGSGDTLENQIWENVCKILRNPEILEQKNDNSSTQSNRVAGALEDRSFE